MNLLIFHHDITKEENNRTEFCANKGFFTSYAAEQDGKKEARKSLRVVTKTTNHFFHLYYYGRISGKASLSVPCHPTSQTTSSSTISKENDDVVFCVFQSLITSRRGNNLCFYHGQTFTVFAYVIFEQRNETANGSVGGKDEHKQIFVAFK